MREKAADRPDEGAPATERSARVSAGVYVGAPLVCVNPGVRNHVPESTRRAMRASAEIGGTALLIDAKDERVAAWYAIYGAMPLVDRSLSLILPFAMFADAVAKARIP